MIGQMRMLCSKILQIPRDPELWLLFGKSLNAGVGSGQDV